MFNCICPISKTKNDENALLQSAADQERNADQAFWAYMAIGACYGISCGACIALIELASTTLGDTLGSLVNGTIFVCFLLSALFLSGSVISVFGPKWSLVFGAWGYVVYVVLYILGYYVRSLIWPASLLAAVIGGIASGLTQTAQGVYLGDVVEVYSSAKGEDKREVSGRFAGYFASELLGAEVLAKILSSVPFYFGDSSLVYFTLGTFCLASAIIVLFVPDSNTFTGRQRVKSPLCSVEKLTGAGRLLCRDTKMISLYPAIMTFGILTAELGGPVNSHLVLPVYGPQGIGFMGITLAGSACIAAAVFSQLGRYTGKGALLTVGQFCWGSICAIIFFIPRGLRDDYASVAVLYVLMGIGRATWEGVIRAIIADVWQDAADRPYAFANAIVAYAFSTAVCFFVFPFLPFMDIDLCGIASAVVGTAAYWLSGIDRLVANQQVLDEEDKEGSLILEHYDSYDEAAIKHPSEDSGASPSPKETERADMLKKFDLAVNGSGKMAKVTTI